MAITKGRGKGKGKRKRKNANAKKKVLRKKICPLCTQRLDAVDYKDVEKLMNFVSDRGKILPRKMSGLCPKHQRSMSRVIKRSRHACIVPFEMES